MAAIDDSPQYRRMPAFLPGPITFPRFSELRSTWARWQLRRSYRGDLKRLLRAGPYMIDDIGLSLGDARRESAKPFWRA